MINNNDPNTNHSGMTDIYFTVFTKAIVFFNTFDYIVKESFVNILMFPSRTSTSELVIANS